MKDASNLFGRAAAAEAVVQIPSGASNLTFSSIVCGNLSASTTTLTIYFLEVPNGYYTVPTCMPTTSPSMTTLTSNYLLISDWRVFPISLTSLSLQSCKFQSSGATPTPQSVSPPDSPAPIAAAAYYSGFNGDGTLDWDGIFQDLPGLVELYIGESELDGSLPASLPSPLKTFTIIGTGLSGSIPSTFFDNMGSASIIYCVLNSNKLTGTIPELLFDPLSWYSMQNLKFLAANNQLSGSLTSSLLYPALECASMTDLQLDFRQNQLNGTIPDGLIATVATSQLFSLDLSDNQFEGSIPPALFYTLNPGGSFYFSARNTGLNGTLPDSILSSAFTGSGQIVIDLSDNDISGTIPQAFFVNSIYMNASFFTLSLDLSSNKLEGPIPEQFLYKLQALKRDTSEDESQKEEIHGRDSASQASSTGARSADYRLYALLPSSSLVFDFSSNMLSGTIPDDLVEYNRDSSPSLTFRFSDNQLTGPIPEVWQDYTGFSTLRLDQNTDFNGTIPSRLFSALGTFNASHTALSGTLPQLGGSTIFDLSYTDIDFCGSPSDVFSSFTGRCTITGLSAVCDCLNYVSKCFTSCVVPTSPQTSPIPPSAPVVPQSSPTVPQSVPSVPQSASCLASTRPSADFQCVNGKWTATTITASALSIPANAGDIFVSGNITSRSLSFQGIGSTIFVGGCVTNLNSIEVSLDNSQVKQLGQNSKAVFQPLVDSSASTASCDSTLSSVGISSRTTSKNCKKVNNQKQVSNNSKTLGAYFSLNSSGCNTWWIVLAAVLGGVILAIVIVTILLVTFCEPIRRKVRPYEQSDGRHTM